MLTYWWPSTRLISDANLMVDGTVPVRLPRRGITVHRWAMLPSPNLYEIRPGVWVGHPVTIRALEEKVRQEMEKGIDRASSAILGLANTAAQTALTIDAFEDAVNRVRGIQGDDQ